jgi:hypothetical protein
VIADIATYRINYDVESWRKISEDGRLACMPFGAALAINHLCNEYERLTAELAQYSNFCGCCGKRNAPEGEMHIHTCTPPGAA